MEEERDFVVFTDDDGNDFELNIIDYFEYEGDEYAVLTDPAEELEEDAEVEVYIMKIEVDEAEEYEEFLPPDEDKMEVLCAIVEQRLSGACGCGEDCDCEEHECGCGEADCHCGCNKQED